MKRNSIFYIFPIALLLQYIYYRGIKVDADVTFIDMLGVSVLMTLFMFIVNKFLSKK
ncbi:conserved hypothetical protein [Bacillus mycoides]|uniref:Uncharacterized protein n=2 Tax=Bacillus mycoides TaxID=1405 RepID=A9VVU9_BACMK|nr:hypothetical protein BcerKBAB4_5863 [Bacillus mycoides KBAB4]VXC69545.1 conserved hypothetical protein [Bacillus mycoides]